MVALILYVYVIFNSLILCAIEVVFLNELNDLEEGVQIGVLDLD